MADCHGFCTTLSLPSLPSRKQFHGEGRSFPPIRAGLGRSPEGSRASFVSCIGRAPAFPFRSGGGEASEAPLKIGRCMLRGIEDFDRGDGGRNSTGGGSGGGGRGNDDNEGEGSGEGKHYFLVLLVGFFKKRSSVGALIPTLFIHYFLFQNLNAYADASISPPKPSVNTVAVEGNAREAKLCDSEEALPESVFELRGGHWRRILIDFEKDEFVANPVKKNEGKILSTDEWSGKCAAKPTHVWGFERFLGRARRSVIWCWNITKGLMLPEGYPESVTGDYLEYTLWRMGQGIASQINGVLTTQALLYAVGLGKGAIPTAAAVNWVLKDGIGYLSKILLAKYGRHFDVHPKGWRLVADLMENGSYGLELLTPTFPHLFVYLGAAAGAGRSAAGLIQAATRSCFYAGFAAQRNFAEVIAKGEAQGMVSKSLGIMLGIAISGYVGSSGPLLVGTFIAVSGAHMFCNLRSYQAVQLRTLNPYRASLVFGEYIRSGIVASVKEVNAEEPIFTEIPFLRFRLKGVEDKDVLLSLETKEDAAILTNRLNVGVPFGDVIRSQSEADQLFKVYQKEQYVLIERQSQYQVLLKVGATSHDLLRMMLQVCYLFQLQGRAGKSSEYITSNIYEGDPIETSYNYMVDRFAQVQQDLVATGWVTSDGLVSRPLPFRLLESLPVNTAFL